MCAQSVGPPDLPPLRPQLPHPQTLPWLQIRRLPLRRLRHPQLLQQRQLHAMPMRSLSVANMEQDTAVVRLSPARARHVKPGRHRHRIHTHIPQPTSPAKALPLTFAGTQTGPAHQSGATQSLHRHAGSTVILSRPRQQRHLPRFPRPQHLPQPRQMHPHQSAISPAVSIRSLNGRHSLGSRRLVALSPSFAPQAIMRPPEMALWQHVNLHVCNRIVLR